MDPLNSDIGVQDELPEDYSDSLFEDDERPGRFTGPDSTWRDHTRAERELASAVEQADHDNLSIHLFNCHAWKARNRSQDTSAAIKAWQSKQRWLNPESHDQPRFLPPRDWTTWPMDPSDVPRKREMWGVPTIYPDSEAGYLFKPEPWIPGSNMRDEINALVLRVAAKRSRIRKQAQLAQQKNESQNSDSKATGEKQEAENQLRAHREPLKRSIEQFSVIVDDEEAASISRPITRHLLAQLDHLLTSLHKSRRGHTKHRTAGVSKPSKKRSLHKASERDSRYHPVEDEPAANPGRRESSEDRQNPLHDSQKGRESIQNYERTRAGDLAPRDWSEILSLAHVTGWEPLVLDRASRRCASLFGECITFRNMPETSVAQVCDTVVHYTPESVQPCDESLDELSASDHDQGQVHWPCPFRLCTRASQPFPQVWRLREHLQRTHHLDRSAVAHLVLDAKAQAQSQPQRAWRSSTEPSFLSERSTKAVHDDGYMQPIMHPFDKSANKDGKSAG